MTVAFDNTMLSILLNPDGKTPNDPETKKPVEHAKERAEHLVEGLQKSRRKIVLPAPAVSELLTAIGPDAQQYINLVSRSRVFEIGDFDARGASELALLNRGAFKAKDTKNKAEPYQKRKVDRQIVAICKVYGATELYTDDDGLSTLAKLCGITPIATRDLAVPDSTRQGGLALEPHEEIPIGDDDG